MVYELLENTRLPFDVIIWSPNHVILLIKEGTVCAVRAVLVDSCLPIVNTLLKAVDLDSKAQTKL